ncbi:hypothetical protein HAX54_015250, partial [Datura stramonium]|nr:hypothetical protein [Datura stramonium]
MERMIEDYRCSSGISPSNRWSTELSDSTLFISTSPSRPDRVKGPSNRKALKESKDLIFSFTPSDKSKRTPFVVGVGGEMVSIRFKNVPHIELGQTYFPFEGTTKELE